MNVEPGNTSSIVAYFLSSRLYWDELEKNARVAYKHFEMQADDEGAFAQTPPHSSSQEESKA